MNNTLTRSQRTRKITSRLANLNKDTKLELQQKMLDDLESDQLEELISSADSASEFEEDDGSDQQKESGNNQSKQIKKKKKKTKKDKRNIMVKSKVNLKQMVNDMHRKGLT